jgi:hypothetical protein
MLVRRTLQLALLALVATVVLTVVWNIAIGVGEPTLGGIIASYLLWGRWVDFATLVLFAAILIAAPFLPGTRRAGHIIVTGAAIAMVGDLINISNLAGADAGRLLGPDELAAAFSAGRVLGFSTDPTSMFTWVTGMILIAIGLLILSMDAQDRKWGRASGALGVAFGVMAATGMNVFGAVGSFWIASSIAVGVCFYWLHVALRVTAESNGTATSDTQQASASPR